MEIRVDIKHCECGGFITAFEGMYELHIKTERHQEWLKKFSESPAPGRGER